jgi:hypothetical protein
MGAQGRMGMVRLFEKDLDSMVSTLPLSAWTASVQFIYSAVLLNLYSSCLLHSSSSLESSTDETLIQSSAARCACEMIRIYASRPMVAGTTELHTCPDSYFPKSYRHFHFIALVILLKISALNRVSAHQLAEIEHAIRLGHGALVACSKTEGDESYKAAAVVEILCNKGVIQSEQAGPPSASRFGASLWHELVAIAIRWHRQHSPGRFTLRNSGQARQSSANHAADVSQTMSTTQSTLGNGTRSTPWASSNATDGSGSRTELDTAAFDLLPFSIEDWFNQEPVGDMDLGFAQADGWWDGAGLLGLGT